MTEEISIPVPWGHIAGKQSGLQGGPIVLCLHGLQDNAGSFDRLIPLLPKHFQYIAIDLPGHGKSSHFKRGTPIVFTNYVFSIKLIIDYYKWNKIILLAHSFGTEIAVPFASIYPEFCLKIIVIDVLIPALISSTPFVKFYRRRFNQTVEMEQKLISKSPPLYTHEEALDRLINSRYSTISIETAKILLKRALIKNGDKFCFSTDIKLRKILESRFPFSETEIIILSESFKNIKCPILILITSDVLNFILNTLHGDYKTYLRKLNLDEPFKNFTLKIIEGNHDVHSENAPLVAENIASFLLHTKSSL